MMNYDFRLFIGSKKMFYLSIWVFILFLFTFFFTYIYDLTYLFYTEIQDMDVSEIEQISTSYVSNLGISVDVPIVYRWVKYKDSMHKRHAKKQGASEEDEMVVLGTFHEWNGKYYIDISVDAKSDNYTSDLYNTVTHETRHMLVRFLRKEKIMNLEKYTEDIAYATSPGYNQIFSGAMFELREKQKIKK